ncbi:hypothetical protein KC727_02450 [Candidatus Kaiserbacteria bacterium]|nr:hypothetical protein [Candidatus Kaiserbacteria bacterium]
MESWYVVSGLGWVVAIFHIALNGCVLFGFSFFPETAPEHAFFQGAVYINVILLGILLYAEFKQIKIFRALTKQ